MPKITKLITIITLAALWVVLMGCSNFSLKKNQNANTNAHNQNTKQTNINNKEYSRPTANIINDSKTNKKVFEYNNPGFTISFPKEWYFSEPLQGHPNYNYFLLIASNEDADSILNLRPNNDGIVVYLYIEPFSKNINQYFKDSPVSPFDIAEDRINIEQYTVNDKNFLARTIDSTNLEDWEGGYTKEYINKFKDYIIKIIFVSLNQETSINNEKTINSILGSIIFR